MGYIITFFLICLGIVILYYIALYGIVFYLAFLVLSLVIPILFKLVYNFFWRRYENKFFSSEQFQIMKLEVYKYVKECNELNEHISDLKVNTVKLRINDNGYATTTDTSHYNYKRTEWDKYEPSSNIHYCSLQVCRNAQNQPYKYLCKYFNINIDEDALNKFEQLLNIYSSVEEGKKILNQKYQRILTYKNLIPKSILKKSNYRLHQELGLHQIDLKEIEYPKYVFQYISAGGNSSMNTSIVFDVYELNKFINYLDKNIKWKNSIRGQRALMTSDLRFYIKDRDNHTCQRCGNSTSKEPNLLLEIDHIIPLSKGGKTIESNLQTLCWRCNRSKGSKLDIKEETEKATTIVINY